jgi:hypothetical protein
MSPIQTTGKVASGAIDAMKATPILLAAMIIIMGSLVFAAYLLGEVAANAGERNKAQLQLIEKLVGDIRDCRQGPKPNGARSLLFKDATQ